MISIWEKESFFAPQDIIIVGNGFVGLWSAFHLKKKKPKLKSEAQVTRVKLHFTSRTMEQVSI